MYSVGVTDSGTTVLTLGDDSGYKSTLTMNEGAVIQMIRLLSATLRTVNVTFEGIDNGQCETGESDTSSPVVETP
jgi:hypothetical protein